MDNILGYVILLQLAFACCRFFASCDEQDQSSCKERAKHESPVLTQLTEPVDHAEGPHWDPERQRLLYVDISGRAIHTYNPQDNQHTSLTLNKTVSLVIPVRDSPDTFVIGYGTDLAIVTWDGQHPEHDLKVLATVDAEHPGNRFNDGKADNNGRVWAGTMGEETTAGVQPNLGSLYRWSYEKCNLEKMVTPVSISNGVAWSSDLKTMYYIDSPTRNIDKFPYNIVDGSLGKRQTVFSLDSYNIPGVPDGMTTDSNNNLWIAIWGGSRVINVEPKTGTLLRTINLPVERVTSVTFGGKYLDILFITTMRKGLNCTQLIQQPQAGAVFSVTNLGVTGTFNNPAVIPNCLH